ncbi:fibronectin type III domain-containing protein [Streptomyces sp. NPDC053493]|uniref:fibronectin type III domain-containing protein n=1 Tax=Streptomyces sp. NPDC053493 TaxID=3365705 RepID=UPI0037CFC0A2
MRVVTAASAVVFLAAASLTTAAGSQAGEQGLLTAEPLETWQTDGIVWALEYAHGVVYVGGTFDHVRPPGAKAGERDVARKNFAAFDAVTGELLPCAPSFTEAGNTVRALKTSPDGTVLYVGGSFGKVDGTGVASAVALDTADCALRPDFRPAMAAPVRAIETTDTAVYVGGDFTAVNGKPQQRIAAFTPSGTLLPFKADIDAPVWSLVAALDHGKILVGGDFTKVNTKESRGLAALDPTTGATVRVYPGWLPIRSGVKALVRDGVNFYVGAEGRGTGIFDGRIAGRLSDDAMLWKDWCWGATQALALHNGVLYSGSHAHDCSQTPGGFPEVNDRQHFLANSVADKHILHWFPDTDDGTGEGNGPRALEMAGGILWAGGEFTEVNDSPQQSLTRFSAGPAGAAPDAAPRLSLAETGAGEVTLSWRAAWDRDDAELTYLLYRDGDLVAAPTQRSTAWSRPTMKFTDAVEPGARHQYTIVVTDGSHTTRPSEPLDVRAVADERPAGER